MGSTDPKTYHNVQNSSQLALVLTRGGCYLAKTPLQICFWHILPYYFLNSVGPTCQRRGKKTPQNNTSTLRTYDLHNCNLHVHVLNRYGSQDLMFRLALTCLYT
jgi:hypothetical protein